MGRVNRRLDKLRSLGLAPAAIPHGYLSGLVEVTLRGSVLAQAWNAVFHVKFGGVVGLTQLEEAATAYFSEYSATMMGSISSDVILEDSIAKDLSVADGSVFVYTPTAPSQGASIAGTEAPYQSMKVKLRTSNPSRAGIGWKRLPGIPDSHVARGVILAGDRSDWQDKLDEFLASVNVNTADMVVASFVKDNATRVPVLASPVLSLDLQADITTQNSRKFGRGA